MSLELLKFQTDEGYSFSPSTNKLANFSWQVPGVVDMSKSYIVADVSIENNDRNSGKYGFADSLERPLNPACMFKNVKIWCEDNDTYKEETRYNNRLITNKKMYMNDLEDNRTEHLYGKGIDKKATNIGETVFSANYNKLGPDETQASAQRAKVLIPFSDLSQDIGSRKNLPMLAMGKMRMELELEDRVKILHEITLEDEISVSVGTTTTNLTKISPELPPNENPFFVGQVVKFSGTISAGGGMIDPTNRTIARIDVSDGTTLDGFGTAIKKGRIIITVNNSIIAGGAGNQTVTALRITSGSFDGNGPADFKINDMNLVLCKKNLPQDIVMAMVNEVQQNGLDYYTWRETTKYGSATNDYEEYFTLAPLVSCSMLSPVVSDKLYADLNNCQSYRLAWDDEETTDRDVIVNPAVSVNYDSLYRHNVLLAVDRTKKDTKNLKPRALLSNYDLKYSADEDPYVMNVWQALPETNSHSILQVVLRSSDNMPARNYHMFQWQRKKFTL